MVEIIMYPIEEEIAGKGVGVGCGPYCNLCEVSTESGRRSVGGVVHSSWDRFARCRRLVFRRLDLPARWSHGIGDQMA